MFRFTKRIRSEKLTRFMTASKFNSTSNTARNPEVQTLMAAPTLCNNRFSVHYANALQSANIINRRFSSQASSKPEVREFQAETRKLLDIVTNSIYTDKEVFLRELISNASDALEKLRYKQVLGEVSAKDIPLEITITTDKENKTLTIQDSGIGMTKDELISNLGTIARSGSKSFVESATTSDIGIIGQFGVGFYSSFMTSDSVEVESIPAGKAEDQEIATTGHRWSSDGSGVFTVEEIPTGESFTRGSKIVMKLKDSCKEYADTERLKEVIKKYSSFVAFPIKLDGEVVNTVSAIWTQDKQSVTATQYKEFYRFIANSYDEPKYTLHFRADAPIDLRCLFFIPTFHTEKFGQGRMEPGVNLYSRKVLIESKPKDLLPEWLRFVKGVVDSEDLPLSISREKPQDSNLLRRIREVITRKLLRFMDEQSRDDPKKYKEFYLEFNYFLKEGICHDFKFVEQLSKLLLFETSAKDGGELISLDDYISRCTPEQKDVYYIVAPSREAALMSPYYETFKKHNKEVLFLYNAIDDFVMGTLKSYGGRSITSANNSNIDFADAAVKDAETEEKEKDASAAAEGEDKGEGEAAEKAKPKTALSTSEAQDVCLWLTDTLGSKRVREVKVTNRLWDSPAIVTDNESASLRKMMKLVEQSQTGRSMDYPPQVLEINPQHPIIVRLAAARSAGGEAEAMAKLVAEQLLDNALIAAGLVDDPRTMLGRLNSILEASLKA